jgi:Tfp pilus assembly protein PilF
MHRSAPFFAALLVAGSFAAAAQSKSSISQFQGANISGQLQLASGFSAQLMGIKIVLQSRNGEEVARTTTDSKGRFQFRDVAPGVYLVSVRQQGYVDRPRQADVSFTPQAQVFVDLVPEDDTAKPQPVSGTIDAALSKLSPEAQQAFTKGLDLLFKQKNPEKSIAEFKKVEKLAPEFSSGYVHHGLALLDLGKLPEAESILVKAVKKSPDDFYANFYLGVSLNSEQKFTDAERVLRTAVQKRQDSAEANYELSRSLMGQGRWEDAGSPAARCNQIAPEYAPVQVVLGNISLRKRDANGALEHFREYLRLDPNGPFSQQTREMVTKIEAALSKHD